MSRWIVFFCFLAPHCVVDSRYIALTVWHVVNRTVLRQNYAMCYQLIDYKLYLFQTPGTTLTF